MKVICAFLLSLCLFACRQTTKVRIEPKETDTTTNAPVAEQTCYTYVKNRDTATLSLTTTGVAAAGELDYKLFEKDKNMGSVEGEMHGDTLIANYTFSSEGRQSVRQVVFLKKGDQLLEGTGQVEEKNGKTQFKNLSNLEFGKAIVFEKIACN
jgi:hypothetical protein